MATVNFITFSRKTMKRNIAFKKVYLFLSKIYQTLVEKTKVEGFFFPAYFRNYSFL